MNNLVKLRLLLKKEGIEAYAIPSTDEFQNEYTPPYARRLEWISGFSGSNGTAIITQKSAVLYTDARYLLQAQQELSKDWDVLDMYAKPSCKFFGSMEHGVLGLNPALHTKKEFEYYTNLAQKYNFTIKKVSHDLVDQIWERSPNYGDVQHIDPSISGMSTEEKIAVVLEKINKNATHLLITACDAVSWLLNIRGAAVPYTPVVLAFALLSKDGFVHIFSDEDILNFSGVLPKGSKVIPLAEITAYLKGEIQCDPQQASELLSSYCKIFAPDPVSSIKAEKNPLELNGMRLASELDSIAIIRFFYWLDNASNFSTSSIHLDEIKCAEKMLYFRKMESQFLDNSFSTISAFGANGAVIHYSPKSSTNAKLGRGLYLIDSGGHYVTGTTDVTRVWAIGEPTKEEKYWYTVVLKAHITLALTVFPYGTMGMQLDAITRAVLWRYGGNYAHGTGHGVGHRLSVHEGPQKIGTKGEYPLKPGMVVSNEPGYYNPGKYGIRIENLMLVRESVKYKGFCEFETLTLVPYCKALINEEMLDNREKKWLADYQSKVIQNFIAKSKDEIEITNWLQLIKNGYNRVITSQK